MAEHNLPCEDCGSSRALSDYGDHTFCHSCRVRKETNGIEKDTQGLILNLIELQTDFKDMDDRGISQNTAEKYLVFPSKEPLFSWVYPQFRDGKHVANKMRTREKKGFLVNGDWKDLELFGQRLFPAGSAKSITITEGYDDAMAAYEMFGSKYPVVSVHSASTAKKDVAAAFEYLDKFDEIVIAFDRDDPKVHPDGSTTYPGQEAALEVAGMFKLGKVRLLTYALHKDANDYLKAGDAKAFQQEWWKAPRYTPAGLKLAKEMWEEVQSEDDAESVPWPWKTLNDYTFGIRKSEFVLLTALTGVGKTSVVKEAEWEILQQFLTHKVEGKLGLLHLEERNKDTLRGLMSITADKPLHIPDVRKGVSRDELKRYFDDTCNNDGLVIWDHFGSNSIDAVLAKIRHMHNLGCDYIFFDHLSIVVSDQHGDERKDLDEISTKLKTICMELNVAVIGVIHQNRTGQIRGSAGPEQLANIVIKLFRDVEDDDPWRRNITKLVIQKNRFTGRTGPACYLEYIPDTGRLVELSDEDVKKYESKAKPQEEDAW